MCSEFFIARFELWFKICLMCSALSIMRKRLGCDGGDGVVHMGMALFGKRGLNCWAEGGPKTSTAPAMVLEQSHRFLFCSSAFRHQVKHRPCDQTELASLGHLQDLSVSVMFRSTLFPYNRSRLAQSTPSP